MKITLLFIIISIFFLFLDLLRKRNSYRCRNLSPSPPALLIIGHFHILKYPLYHTFQKLSHKYGRNFTLQLGKLFVVVISSPSAVEECFTKNDIILANRVRFMLGKYLAYNNTFVSTLPYDDLWRNLRRISTLEVFSNKSVNKFSSIRKEEIKILLDKISKNSLHGFVKIELKSMFIDLTFNIVMRTIAGKRYEEKTKQFREIMREIVSYGRLSNTLDFFPVLAWIGYGGIKKRLKTLGKIADEFFQDIIDDQRYNRGSDTVIDRLLSSRIKTKIL